MNKVTKAAVAAGAAAALMLGGAGSLALWNDSKDVDAGTVSTGELTLAVGTTGTWIDSSDGAVFDTETAKLVPGDTLTLTQTVDITADGKNLQGELTVGDLAGGEALPLGVTAVATGAPGPGLVVDGAGVFTFAAAGTYSVPVTITLTWPKGTPGSEGIETMNLENIDLGALTLNLDQVRP